jgi:hypothetical protein
MTVDDRRCKFIKSDGSRCSSWAVRKPEIENADGLCSGHLGLGLAKAPRSYARLGGAASARSREKATLHAEGEEALAVLREALEDGRFADPIVEAKARQLLDRKTLSALEAKQALTVAKGAAEGARTEAEEERVFYERFVRRNWGDLSPESWQKFETWQRENAESRRRDTAWRKQRERSEQAVAAREVSVAEMPKRKRRRRSTYLPPHIAYKDAATVDAYERQMSRSRGRFVVPVTLW